MCFIYLSLFFLGLECDRCAANRSNNRGSRGDTQGKLGTVDGQKEERQ